MTPIALATFLEQYELLLEQARTQMSIAYYDGFFRGLEVAAVVVVVVAVGSWLRGRRRCSGS